MCAVDSKTSYVMSAKQNTEHQQLKLEDLHRPAREQITQKVQAEVVFHNER